MNRFGFVEDTKPARENGKIYVVIFFTSRNYQVDIRFILMNFFHPRKNFTSGMKNAYPAPQVKENQVFQIKYFFFIRYNFQCLQRFVCLLVCFSFVNLNVFFYCLIQKHKTSSFSLVKYIFNNDVSRYLDLKHLLGKCLVFSN